MPLLSSTVVWDTTGQTLQPLRDMTDAWAEMVGAGMGVVVMPTAAPKAGGSLRRRRASPVHLTGLRVASSRGTELAPMIISNSKQGVVTAAGAGALTAMASGMAMSRGPTHMGTLSGTPLLHGQTVRTAATLRLISSSTEAAMGGRMNVGTKGSRSATTTTGTTGGTGTSSETATDLTTGMETGTTIGGKEVGGEAAGTKEGTAQAGRCMGEDQAGQALLGMQLAGQSLRRCQRLLHRPTPTGHLARGRCTRC